MLPSAAAADAAVRIASARWSADGNGVGDPLVVAEGDTELERDGVTETVTWAVWDAVRDKPPSPEGPPPSRLPRERPEVLECNGTVLGVSTTMECVELELLQFVYKVCTHLLRMMDTA